MMKEENFQRLLGSMKAMADSKIRGDHDELTVEREAESTR
jgi:hypothetical protein